MADEASIILFAIVLKRAGFENLVKYVILRVRMSLCLSLCATENRALWLTRYISFYFPYNTDISGIGWLVGGSFIGDTFLAINVTA